jgi:hypothetical protein
MRPISINSWLLARALKSLHAARVHTMLAEIHLKRFAEIARAS